MLTRFFVLPLSIALLVMTVSEGQHIEVTIKGRVINAGGEQVGGVDVTWKGSGSDVGIATKTGPDGTFVLTGVEAGIGVISVEGDFYRSRHRVRVSPDSNPPFTLTVKTFAALQLQVPEDALPEEEVKVVVRNLETDVGRRFRFRTAWLRLDQRPEKLSDTERREEARRAIAYYLDPPPLVPGRYRIEATWDGKSLGSMDLTLEAGKTKAVTINPKGPLSVLDLKDPSDRVNLPEAMSSDKEETIPNIRPLYVDIAWDKEKQKGQILVKDTEFNLQELKAWLYPYARYRIDPDTMFSKVSLIIRCDKHAPFRLVQQVLSTCAHRDIQIYKIYLAVQRKRPGKKPVPGKLATFLPTRAHPEDKIQINLAMKNDQCLVYVNGRCVGSLPDATAKVRKRLESLASGPDAMVQIEPRTGVCHGSVVMIVDECRRAKISRIAFSAASGW
jgi:biopolymer transport protein ExbD